LKALKATSDKAFRDWLPLLAKVLLNNITKTLVGRGSVRTRSVEVESVSCIGDRHVAELLPGPGIAEPCRGWRKTLKTIEPPYTWPVCTVVREERNREASPYPDYAWN